MPEHIFHIRSLAWHIVFTLCLPALLFAQPPTIYTENEAEAYNDLLRDLEGISLELNRASAKDLLILPGLTPELVRRIIARRPYRTLQRTRQGTGFIGRTHRPHRALSVHRTLAPMAFAIHIPRHAPF